jgi:hypothetical protein
MKRFLTLFVSISVLVLCLAKRTGDQIKAVRFNRESWKYLTKFDMNAGTGTYKFRMKLKNKIDESRAPPETVPI